MKLYHGTIYDFTVPDLSKGRRSTDFGIGFYLTDSERMADDWLKGEPGKRVNVYELTLGKVQSCNLHIRRYETASVEWAKFVYNNRKNRLKSNQFDIIIGPLADNALNKWFDMIDNSLISWEELADKISYRRYNSLQFCFKSQKSIMLLEYANSK
jgi:hypothetical protein